jgi:hypothetical protein
MVAMAIKRSVLRPLLRNFCQSMANIRDINVNVLCIEKTRLVNTSEFYLHYESITAHLAFVSVLVSAAAPTPILRCQSKIDTYACISNLSKSSNQQTYHAIKICCNAVSSVDRGILRMLK